MELLVGCDPEVFVSFNKAIIPVCGLIGADKNSHKKISETTDIHEDNVLLELNIKPVKYKNDDSLFDATAQAVEEARDYLKGINKRFDIEIVDSFSFTAECLAANEKANQFGCEAFLNAYTNGNEAILPEMGGNTYRSGGGHIHFGYDTSKVAIPKWALVLLCDLAMLTVVRKHNAIGHNRIYNGYGAPGSYRDKSYGFEYRTPSNQWLNEKHKEVQAVICRAVKWGLDNPNDLRDMILKKIDVKALGEALTNEARVNFPRRDISKFVKIFNKTIN